MIMAIIGFVVSVLVIMLAGLYLYLSGIAAVLTVQDFFNKHFRGVRL